MNDLVSKGFPKSRSAYLAGIARSMIYYQRKKRERQCDADLEKRISHIVEERPSYGTRRVTAMIRRSGSRMGRNRIRRHMRHMNLISTRKKVHRKHVLRKIVVARPNMMWETDFTKIYIDNEGRVHLTAYLDLCSRKIKGHLVTLCVLKCRNDRGCLLCIAWYISGSECIESLYLGFEPKLYLNIHLTSFQ